jgi:hypothetical protein
MVNLAGEDRKFFGVKQRKQGYFLQEFRISGHQTPPFL